MTKVGDRKAVLVKETSAWEESPDFNPDYAVIYGEDGCIYYVALDMEDSKPAQFGIVVLEIVTTQFNQYATKDQDEHDTLIPLWRIVRD